MSCCQRCGNPDDQIPGHPEHVCTGATVDTPVRIGSRLRRDIGAAGSFDGEVVEINRTVARVYWPKALYSGWYSLDECAEWLVAS